MAITVGGTSITMNDSTVQATAFLGGRATVFTTNGTFTIPTGITAVKVTVVGGGAGGSGSWSGSAGAAAIKYLTGLTAGNTLSVTIGAAGSGISTTGSSTGGNSSVASGTQSITTIQANGGTTASALTPGAVATTSGADIAINGGRGGYRTLSLPGVGTIYGSGGFGSTTSTCCTFIAGSAAVGYGAGGGGNMSGTGYAGAPGIVIFEY